MGKLGPTFVNRLFSVVISQMVCCHLGSSCAACKSACHGSGALLRSIIIENIDMVLTADDIAAITQIVATTMAQMAATQPTFTPPTTPPSKVRSIDERHYRKISSFSGSNWKDFSFQFKAATRSSSDDVYKMLCWAEQETSEIDPTSYVDMTDEMAKQVSGEMFNILTTCLTGEPLQMMHNCNFNGMEAWRRLTKRCSPTSSLRAM